MSSYTTYRGFWGIQSGRAVEELVDFLSWNREDWAHFEKWLDSLEKKTVRGKKVPRRAWRQTIYGLQRTKLIERKKVAERMMVRLSDKGWRAVIASRIRATRAPCPHGYCIVAFDIPEAHCSARRAFRSFLAGSGFLPLQLSIWYSPRAVTNLLCEMVDELGIRDWVTVIEGNIKRKRG